MDDPDSYSSWNDFGWAICASVSLSSSKYLLIDLNLHYPFLLHTLQLSFTVLLGTLELGLKGERLRSPVSSTGCARTICLQLLEPRLVAMPGVLLVQAILHFSNLATIAMLAVS